jgi:hypothetical protein
MYCEFNGAECSGEASDLAVYIRCPIKLQAGNGQVTGEEFQISVNFSAPFGLPPGQYFFVPQVSSDSGDFLWLSAPRAIVSPETPFPPGFTDLQTWT